MAERNYFPPEVLNHREVPLSRSHPYHRSHLIDDRRAFHRGPVSPSPPLAPTLTGDHLATQQREIQFLLVDNQRLASAHVALKRELAAAQQELHHLSSDTGAVKAERDAQVREVYERSLKMEAEVRSIDALDAELVQVRTNIQKLSTEKKELTSKLQGLNDDLLKARSELQQLPSIEAEIKTMHHEIQRGRAAIEYEKKMHATNLEQAQAMEKNMISMAREIEKLRAELANAEKRARAAAAAAVTATPSYGNSEMSYGGNPYPDPYAVYQVQSAAGADPHYDRGTVIPQGHYDMQWNHAHR